MRKVVCKQEEIEPGDMMEAKLGPIPIIVCRTPDGEFYALANRCLHQGAPLSEGVLCGAAAPTDSPGEYNYIKEGEVLRCPWHGIEYDIKSGGRMLADPHSKLKSFNVDIEEGDVVVSR